jgi:hypothetical protein
MYIRQLNVRHINSLGTTVAKITWAAVGETALIDPLGAALAMGGAGQFCEGLKDERRAGLQIST